MILITKARLEPLFSISKAGDGDSLTKLGYQRPFSQEKTISFLCHQQKSTGASLALLVLQLVYRSLRAPAAMLVPIERDGGNAVAMVTWCYAAEKLPEGLRSREKKSFVWCGLNVAESVAIAQPNGFCVTSDYTNDVRVAGR